MNEGVNGSPFNQVAGYDGSASSYVIRAGDVHGLHTIIAGGLYRIKTVAENAIGLSYFSEELIVALARKPEKPIAPTFDSVKSNRFQNVLVWQQGISIDIPVSGYRLYSDNGMPGNRDLVYDGAGISEVLSF